MRHSAVLLIALASVLNVSLTGCHQQSQQKGKDEVVSVQAAIETECIAHYYKSNGSAYITRQWQDFNPEAGYFHASAIEPIGKVQCFLKKDVFNSTGMKKEALSDLPNSFWDQDLATLLFYGFCGGGDLLQSANMVAGENRKIEGQWYKPLTPAWPTSAEVTLLQSIDSNRVELVELNNSLTDVSWLVRCYNFSYNSDLEKTVPCSIDVFDIQGGIASKGLMIRFDYKNIRKVPNAEELE